MYNCTLDATKLAACSTPEDQQQRMTRHPDESWSMARECCQMLASIHLTDTLVPDLAVSWTWVWRAWIQLDIRRASSAFNWECLWCVGVISRIAAFCTNCMHDPVDFLHNHHCKNLAKINFKTVFCVCVNGLSFHHWLVVLWQRLAQLEGVSEQIEQAKMLIDGCESENDCHSKTAVAGTVTLAFVVLKPAVF